MNWEIISKEIKYSFSRPSSTGGQHIYKMETRVKLQFDVTASKGLSPEERKVLLKKFDHIISKKGILSLNAERDRSQLANRKYVTERFHDMLAELFKPKKKRTPTRRPDEGNEKRLKAKHIEGARKQIRKKPQPEE